MVLKVTNIHGIETIARGGTPFEQKLMRAVAPINIGEEVALDPVDGFGNEGTLWVERLE